MAGRIPQAFIDDLLVRVDIVELIDSYIPLKKTGSSYVARCPFHTEKTPSFGVTRHKQLYHCFGCGVGGNAITFLMDYNHLDFVEAIEGLSDFIGIDVPRETGNTPAKKTNVTKIFQVLEQVTFFYMDQLRNSDVARDAVEYFKSRGLSGEIAREFQLGYAPDRWDSLSQKFGVKDLLDAGLVISKEGTSGVVYDRFRGRIIFPIRDRRGRVLGFGGRVLDNSLPKYLNSPETAVFHKGREVYGLYELLSRNAKPERIIVVEGYMDVIALAQFDIGYSVATLGTATSREHLELLFRFSSEIVLCFDGDSAGKKAAWRAVKAALPCLRDGRQVRIMALPDGVDPDTLIRTKGREAFELDIKSAKVLSDYFFEHLSDGLDLSHAEGQSSLIEKAKGSLKKIPNGSFQIIMEDKLESLSKVSKSKLDLYEKPTRLRAVGVRYQVDQKKSPVRTTISLLLQNPDFIQIIEQKKINWSMIHIAGVDLLQQVVEIIIRNPNINQSQLVEYFRGQEAERHISIMMHDRSLISGEEALKEEFIGAINILIRQSQYMRLQELEERANHLDDQELGEFKNLHKALKKT